MVVFRLCHSHRDLVKLSTAGQAITSGSFPAGEVVKPAHSPHLGQITGKSCQPTYLQVLTASRGPPNLLLHLSFTGRQGTEGLNHLQVICSRSLCCSTARTCRYVSQDRMSPMGLPPPLPSPAGWVVAGSAPLLRVSHGRAGAGWAMQCTGCKHRPFF